jgi:hypothetical protein
MRAPHTHQTGSSPIRPHAAPEPTSGASLDARPFHAELDVAELGDRDEPGPAWTARAESISRSRIAFRSRALSYPGRRLIIAVHLVDGEPVGFAGKVVSCDYCGTGLYHTVLELEYIPREGKAREWLLSRVSRRR